MKVIAAFLLAVLGGKANPSADDIKSILGSGILLCVSFRFMFSFVACTIVYWMIVLLLLIISISLLSKK